MLRLHAYWRRCPIGIRFVLVLACCAVWLTPTALWLYQSFQFVDGVSNWRRIAVPHLASTLALAWFASAALAGLLVWQPHQWLAGLARKH